MREYVQAAAFTENQKAAWKNGAVNGFGYFNKAPHVSITLTCHNLVLENSSALAVYLFTYDLYISHPELDRKVCIPRNTFLCSIMICLLATFC